MQEIRLLLVDDNSDVRKSTAEYLSKQEGIKCVREADNGLSALSILAEEPIDVVVTDIIMPHMDGYTLMEEIRKLDLAPKPKVIAVTALGRDDFVVRAIERGAMYYMVKPFDLPQLLGRIRELNGVSGKEIEPSFPSVFQTQRVQSLDERLSSLFLTIGIPAHIKGYSFLREAVKMVIETPDVINRITKELYPGIGFVNKTRHPTKDPKGIQAWHGRSHDPVGGIHLAQSSCCVKV